MMILLEARGITKIFGRFRALSTVNLTVRENEIHGLIGPNGSGKSTLLKCVAGAELPTEGTIRFAGHDVTAATPPERARVGISLKFQITSVLPALTVYDNVLLALQARSPTASLIFSRTREALHERVMQMLEQFHLAERSTERAAALSHGQQQWLGIAMALACQPRLLLLDEPTAGMSIEERRVTGELLMPIKHRCSVVIVEHDLDFIRDICDLLTVLDQGSVLDSGTVGQIQSSRKVQEVYLTRV
jgi:branched-chain amino acid transport system ATP-binding protein/urea transport system ATP-binding protein